jgi:hypothetical protein
MRKLAVFPTAAMAIALTFYPAATPIGTGTAAAGPSGETKVPITTTVRTCDFTALIDHVFWGKVPDGQGQATIRKSGNTVIADVQFVDSREVGFHYDVGLIQVPRPSSAPCGPGDPGTAYVGMDIGPDGTAAVTVQDTLRSGTTGVYVKIQRPAAHSQDPAEVYTSTFIAHV